MDSYFLRLCWKNLWRNPRRAIITLNAIALSVMALVWIYNYYDAFHDQCIQNAIRYQSGHIVIATKGYHKQKASTLYIPDSRRIISELKKSAVVSSFSSRVTLTGMVSSPYGSANTFFHGVVPKEEMRTTQFSGNLVQGKFLVSAKGHPIVIGRALAETLKVKVGSKVVVLTQAIDGSVGNQLFHVSGIFDTNSEADRGLVFIDIEDARALLSLPKYATNHISILLKKQEYVPQFHRRWQKELPAKQYEVLTWNQVQKHLMAMIELNRSANRILLFLILAVSSLGIANSILMGILERTREFGVMSAIGTAKSEMIKMVITETMLLAFAGTTLGGILGSGLTLYFGKIGFDLKWLTSQPLIINGAIIETISYPTIHWNNFFFVAGIVILLSLAASFIPARYVSKLKTVEALRAN